MSGGAFDYRDHVIFDLKDMVAREIGYLEYGGESWREPVDPKTISYIKTICKAKRSISGEAFSR